MLGIIIEVVASWVLLWLVVKRNLAVLGLTPQLARARQLTIGLVAAGAVCAMYHFSAKYFAGNSWVVNSAYTAVAFAKSAFWTLKSVLFETLIFQGALLYMAIQKVGRSRACLLSAACFGVYHWFSFGAFGNPVQMAFIFFMTAITGFMYAFAFAKTKSLYLTIGLHFGWNLVNIVIFSNGPLGEQLLLLVNQAKLQGLLSLAVFVFQVIMLPVLTYFYLNRLNKSLISKTSL